MHTRTSVIILLFAGIYILSACGVMRRDMLNTGDNGSKGSTARITVDVGNGLVTNESGLNDTFTVVLDLAPVSDVTFPLSSGDGSEIAVSPSSITFTTSNWSTPRVVTVQGVPDGVADGHMPVAVLIGAASSADPNWDGFDPADPTVYNIDVDSASTPGVTVTTSGPLLLSEIGTSGSFAVVLNSQPVANVSIPIMVSDGTEAKVTSPFSGPSGTLLFTITDWNTPQVVLVTGVDDTVMDGNYVGTVYVQAASSGDPIYGGYEPPDVSFTTVDDDSAGVTVSAPPTVYVSESGTFGSFTVVLNSEPTGSVVMNVAVSDATEGVLTAPASGTLTFSPADWDVPQTVTVRGANDFLYDSTVNYPVYVTMNVASTLDSDYDSIDPNDVSFATIDDDSVGVTVSAVTSALVSESGTDSSSSIALNSQPTSDVTINISVPDSSEAIITVPAPSGSNKTLTFTTSNWSTAQTITVAGVNDDVADGNVGFNVVIGSTVSSDSSYNGINPPDLVLTNVDDDTAGVTVIAGTTMVTESGTSASFTVVLNSEPTALPTANVSVPFSIDDPSEGVFASPFVGTTGSVTFTSTDWNTAKVVTVSGVNDGVSDGHQTFRVNFGASSSNDPVYNNFTPPSIFYTCIDDMGGALVPGVVVQALDNPLVVSESGSSASFQVVLTAPPLTNVDIPVSVLDTSEGLITSPAWGASGTISFTPFNWNTPFTVTVTGQDDSSADGNQVFWVTLGNTICPPDPPYNGLPVQDVQCKTIDDDGTPGVTVIAGPEVYVSESGTAASFSVVLNTAPSDIVVINVFVDDATEGTLIAPAAGTLTFNPSNWNISQPVKVQGVDDLSFDGNTVFHAVLSMNTPATLDGSYDPIDPDDVYFINIDDDTAGVTVMTGSYYMVSENGTYCAYQVVLNSQPDFDVTIPVSIDDTTEGGLITPASGLLTFTSANWNSPQTVCAGGLNDYVVDGNQTFKVVLGATSSSDSAYNGTFDPLDVSFLNVDNDSYGITVHVGDGLITKEHPTAPLSDTFEVVLNSQPTDIVRINAITSSDMGEVNVSTAFGNYLEFNSVNWNVPQTVTVKGVDDWISDDFQVVNVGFGSVSSSDTNYNGITINPLRVYNLDDDMGTPRAVIILPPPPIGWVISENGAKVQIPVLLNSMPVASVTVGPITWNAAEADLSVTAITFTPANWNVPQVVTVSGKNDNSATDNYFNIDFGTTNSTDLSWNGIPGGSVSVRNLHNLAAAPSYAKTTLAAAPYTPLSGANLITFNILDITYPVKDEGYFTTPIGFTFYYMGLPYDRLTVFTNGFVTFNPTLLPDNNFRNDALFDNNASYGDDLQNRILAPYWDDLTLTNAGSDAFFKTEGTAPSRMFTVEWVAATVVSYTAKYSFQVVLHEGTNVIEFRYGPKSGAGNHSASAGIKDSLSGSGRFYDIFGVTSAPPNPLYNYGDFPADQFVTYTP